MFEENDLGVTIDHNLSFENHICKKVQLANNIVGLLRRSLTYLDTMSFKKVLCALVRPHLEYAQTVWAPHLQKYIDAIKKVQIRATKLVDGMKSLDYEGLQPFSLGD